MAFVTRYVSPTSGRGVILFLGLTYATLSLVWASLRLSSGEPYSNVAVIILLTGGPAFVLLYGGFQLVHADLDSDLYPLIGGWTLGAVGVMFVLLSLYHFQPADSLRNPYREILVLTALSSVAGLGVGMYDARAKASARELTQRNEDLQRLQAQLEASNERLEQFAYAVSHDLEEPLRMITSYLSLLERRYADELDDDADEFIDYAVDGAERMKEMIDGLLEYSRIETRGESFESVDLDALLADVQQNLELQIDDSDAEITSDALPRVAGDPRQLRQVFQNLLSNALEYSGDDPPRVHVGATRTNSRWQVFVRDEGIGIPPEQQDRVFEVFQRLHSHEEHAGTGIGLALCRRIVERHGGTIWIDSEPGVGTTFTFTLPPAQAPSKPAR
ncbi:4TM region of histidine kinase [Natronorubrum sediminis]|uniref:histidine kinase n=1 Tax=Natronorubrum sediminis TaxID=640943 RepID=A0A1H6FQH6_9EURY|nr:ATP-binding protein [Natronorubrum sediminis]SEH12388.1 4TM region of histidine kinase [Natronorubrum sediminis]